MTAHSAITRLALRITHHFQPMDEDRLRDWMAADLADIAATRMPFGKFGPAHFPPRGVPLYDLPVEYLAWFARKDCFPQGRLGELLRIVHQMKVDGLDMVFDELRRRAGGKTSLRPPPSRRDWHFDD
jgi:uncharacterized protein (DUF3820 family)